MLVGLVGGFLTFGFAHTFGEPNVDKAIAFEEQIDAAKGEPPEEELVSRPVQSTFGLLTGCLVYGTALGGMLALAFAYAYGRVGSIGARETAALVALAGIISVIIVPFIKYPANPPSIGNPETIGARTSLYFGMMVISVVAMFNAVVVARKLAQRHGLWFGSVTAGIAYVVVAIIAMIVLPPIHETPQGFNADVLWAFRTASLGMHLVLWTFWALAFGYLTERSMASTSQVGRRAYS
jgi:hypothetical protein